MATYDYTGGSGASNFPATPRRVEVVQRYVDFSVQNMNSGDVATMINIEPGWVVLAAGFEVTTACTAATTLALGDSGLSTQYVAATASATTGIKGTGLTPKAYTAADSLRLTVGGANPVVGVARVFAIISDTSANRAPAKTATL